MKYLSLITVISLSLCFNSAFANHGDEQGLSTVRIKPSNALSVCLDIALGSQHDGAKVLQEPCVRPSPSGFSSQDFYVEQTTSGDYAIKSAATGKCVQTSKKEQNASVQQQSCRATLEQQFALIAMGEGLFQIRSRSTGRCLEAVPNKTGEGAMVQQLDCKPTNTRQIFLITEGY